MCKFLRSAQFIYVTCILLTGSFTNTKEHNSLFAMEESSAHNLRVVNPEDFWNKIHEIPVSGLSVEQLPELRDQCMDAFEGVIHASNKREVITHYIEQFGKHGPDADFKWVLSAPYYLLSRRMNAAESPASTEVESLIRELVSRRMLNDNLFLERYYRFMLWAGFLGYDDMESAISRELARVKTVNDYRDEADYEEGDKWNSTRNMILIARAFNRTDIINDINNAVDKGNVSDVLYVTRSRFDLWFYKNYFCFVEAETGCFYWHVDNDTTALSYFVVSYFSEEDFPIVSKIAKDLLEYYEFPTITLPEEPFEDFREADLSSFSNALKGKASDEILHRFVSPSND